MEDSSPETEVPSENAEVEATTVEGSPPSEYQPGTGNSMLDALYADPSEKPEEPVDEVPDTIQNVTIEQALLQAAEEPTKEEPENKTSPDDKKEEEPEEKPEENEEPKAVKTEKLDDPEPLPELEVDEEEVSENPVEDEVAQALGDFKPSEEDLETLELAKYASSKDDKYKDLAKDMASFLKKKQEFIDKHSDDYGFEFDPNTNEEVAEFIKKHQPKFTAKERKALEREQLKDEVRLEARREAQAENYRRDLESRKPKVAEKVQSFQKEVSDDIIPEDMAAYIKEHGEEAAREKYAFEVPIIEQSMQQVAYYANEFLSLSQGLKSYEPNNAVHQQISNFVEEQGQIFHKEGGERRIRDGKKFAPRSLYNQMAAKQRKSHWTFSDSEILDMVRFQMREGTKAQIDDVRAKLAKYSGQAPAAPPPQEPAPAPKAKPTKSAGATTSATNQAPNKSAFLDVLGI